MPRAAGEYDRRIRVEQPTRTTAADGQQTAGWPAIAEKPYAKLWAHIETTGGGQQFDQQQRTDQAYIVSIRSSSLTRAITPRMRILVRDRVDSWRTLQIGSAADIDFLGDEVVITCTEQKPAGS